MGPSNVATNLNIRRTDCYVNRLTFAEDENNPIC